MTTLLVASTGGHLTELALLRPYLVPMDDHVVWVTFDSAQSRSLLHGESVVYLPYIGPRQLGRVLAGRRLSKQIFDEHHVTRVISTGSAIALSVLPLAVRRGIRAEYVEAAARTSGPSTTGRLLARLKGVDVFTQWPEWANDRWKPAPSVFENYRPDAAAEPLDRLRKVVVTLGTIEGFAFHRLVARLLEVLPADCEVVWQTGSTDTTGLPVRARALIAPELLQAEMRHADLVVCHAGVGSALSVLALGKRPVLVPRRAGFGEHVDDHQAQIAAELSDRELGVAVEADAFTYADLLAAASLRVAPSAERRQAGGRERFKPRTDRTHETVARPQRSHRDHVA